MSHPAPVPPSRSRLLALVFLAAVVLTAGVFGVRGWNRGAERRAALALAEKGPADQAVPALLAALERAPDDPELLDALVRVRTKTGAPVTDVEPLTERWCRAAPDDPKAFAARADALRRLSRLPEAVAAGERAAALAPNDADHRVTLAGLYLADGRFGDAAREFRALLTAQPGRADFALALARSEWELGNDAEAVRITGELVGRTPPHPGRNFCAASFTSGAGVRPGAGGVRSCARVARPRTDDPPLSSRPVPRPAREGR